MTTRNDEPGSQTALAAALGTARVTRRLLESAIARARFTGTVTDRHGGETTYEDGRATSGRRVDLSGDIHLLAFEPRQRR